MTSTAGASAHQSPTGGPTGSAIAAFGQSPLMWRVLSLALLAAVWEFAGRSGFSWTFPTFSATIGSLWDMIADGSLGAAYLRTAQPLVIGLCISLVVGVSAGVAMGLRREAEWLTLPIFITMQAAPMAALIPLITFVYGIGLTAKVIAVCVLAMPVIAINSFKAVRNVPASLVDMSRAFMGSRAQQIGLIILPAASPMMFAGIRLGVAEGFSGVVLAELLITPTGVGDIITYSRSVAKFADMYAVILSILVVTVLTVSLMHRLETWLFRPEKRGAP